MCNKEVMVGGIDQTRAVERRPIRWVSELEERARWEAGELIERLERDGQRFASDGEKVTASSPSLVATDAEIAQTRRPAALHPSRRRRVPPRRAEQRDRDGWREATGWYSGEHPSTQKELLENHTVIPKCFKWVIVN